MRLFFLVAILLLWQNPAKTPHSQKETQHSKSDESQTAPEPIKSQSVGCGNKAGPTHNPKYQYDYDPRDDRLYRWYMRATIFGACGAIIGIIVLGIQSFLLWRGTVATELSANAAKTSSDTVLNSERARVDTEIQRSAPQSDVHGFIVFNFGRSAAVIQEWRLEQVVFEDIREDLPAIYARKFLQGWTVAQILIPNKVTYIYQFRLTPYLSKGVEEGKHSAFFFVTVHYTDIFDQMHETESVYRYVASSQDNGLANVPKYGRYT